MFTEEQLAAIAKASAKKKKLMLGDIAVKIGDAFNGANLANAYANAETESLIDTRVLAAQRYAALIPVNTTIDADADTILRKGFTDAVGKGKAHSGKGGDIPLAEVVYSDQSIHIGMGSIGYEYTLKEIKAASRRNVPLNADKVAATYLGYESHLYDVAMFGEPNTGKYGLLRHNIPEVFTVQTPWATATNDQILQDLSDAIGMAFDDAELTGNTAMLPNTILIPSKIFRMLSDRTVGNNDKSLLAVLKERNVLSSSGVDVSFEPLPELNTMGEGNTSRIVIYRKDPSALEFILPQEIEFEAPQVRNLEVFTPASYVYGGVWIKSARSVIYLDGA